MKNKINGIMGLLAIILFSNCAGNRIDFSLKNTVSIFLLNNGKNYYFCLPVQYMGDYKVDDFEFDNGYVQVGDYKLLLNRDEINIYAYLNEATDDFEGSGVEFNLVYSEEKGRILISKMGEPLTIKKDSEELWNHYYFFIERHLNNDEFKNIISEYKKGNAYSQYFIWYDITIDGEPQAGSGMYDDFEISDGPSIDYALFFPNLDFFRAKYLQK